MNREESISEFRGLKGIEYFDFEEDFIEKNLRCIPMIVRFKMDAVGIKLKLSEWSRFKKEERIQLAIMYAATTKEVATYHHYLTQLIQKYTGNKPTLLTAEITPAWANVESVDGMLTKKATEFKVSVTQEKWQKLTNLQRFALLKLCKDGHENKNFPKAIREFNLQ